MSYKQIKYLRCLACGLFVLLASACGTAQKRPVSDDARSQMVRILRHVLYDTLQWEKVHAASYLLQLDYQDDVRDVFLEEAQRKGHIPFYRIGIWRVLASAPAREAEQGKWLARIQGVAADTSALDRVHAVESLAKLGMPTTWEPNTADPILNLFIRWANSYATAGNLHQTVDALLHIIADSEGRRQTRERRLAAYAIRNIGRLDTRQWNELADLALGDNTPHAQQVYCLAAAVAAAPQAMKGTQRFFELKDRLITLASEGAAAEKMELSLALAESGGPDDLAMLYALAEAGSAIVSTAGELSDVRAAAAYAILRIDRRHTNSLTVLDWAVIAAYGLLMLWIGWHYSTKNTTRDDYLLGGRRMNPVAVGISLFATLLSTLSYLSYPGEMIQHGPAIFAGMLAFPFVYYAAGWWLIPRIMQMNVTSAYEILEYKLGPSVRVMATFMFLTLRFLWMATIIYVTIDVALLTVVPIDRAYVPLIGIVLMVITIVYTSMGGLKAVVVTDVIQSLIFLGGGLVSVAVVMAGVGSFTGWLPSAWPAHWNPPRLGFDLQERSTIGNAMIMLFVWYICTTGSDQLAIQRYLATKDVATARRSLRVSLYTNLFAKILLAMVGLAMLAYFKAKPHQLADHASLQGQADTLFPRFIMVGLPAGISGLLIAGLLAAAMSSLSSGLNAVSSVISQDVLHRWWPRRAASSNPLRQVRNLSYLTGAVTMVLSIFIAYVEGNLFDVVVKVVNLFVAPLFVLFFMALFVPFATEKGTLFAGATSIAAAIAVAYFGVLGITVLWILPVALVVGVVCGMAFSFFEQKNNLTKS
ncbi:transporter, SSS family [Parapedobacter luteus]|uniref:Transporter, SSS family n=1 Tax=Parapedobacter luteus TaxID=623280 RepID=A0A1T5FM36_9SPHI|nr:sodium/solute symporter [Parapedobacter luteus]SKB97157.1 transporter, SSS family [Parapedobacter luteus]